MRPDQTKGFSKLKKKWDKVLEETGFKDIEKNGKLKDYHSTNWNNPAQAQRHSASRAYFDSAEVIYQTHTFRNPKEKLIWRWHCRGKSTREIVEIWSRFFEHSISQPGVVYIINRICRETGLKCEQSRRKAV